MIAPWQSWALVKHRGSRYRGHAARKLHARRMRLGDGWEWFVRSWGLQLRRQPLDRVKIYGRYGPRLAFIGLPKSQVKL